MPRKKREPKNLTSEDEKLYTKRGKPRKRNRKGWGLKIPGTDENFQRTYPGEDPKKIIHNAPKQDPEEIPANDELDSLKYPPPKNNPIFRKVWAQFIDDISERENFKLGHLNALEVLCDLFVEYEELQAYLRKNGRTYKSISRAGEVYRLYPEAAQLTRVQAQMNSYMKTLGLLLKKDKAPGTGGEDEEWK